MHRCQQLAPADWLVRSKTPWPQLATYGPSCFEAYARLRFLPDPEFAGQRESNVTIPIDHPTEVELARRALRYLAPFTETADECYFCVWDGYGVSEADPAMGHGPLLAIPERRYALFTGPLDDIARWERTFTSHPAFAPAFVWPADRRWCFTSDVDPHWAGIGAERAAVDALVTASDIDAVHADPARQPTPYA
ncbi:MAG: hypothetical protein QOE23_1125 [Pseudonocardiales bacterium]|jgi:hypothetical protein|nr:hypothetical protein [Pseudonocardiales bacterium]